MGSGEQQPARGPRSGSSSIVRQILAWCVHAYTAIGLILAAVIGVLIVQGGPQAFRGAFLLMLVATLVDATDGTLARAARVTEVLPQFDGRQLDYLIDFLTYVALPIMLLWRADILPAREQWWLLMPLVAGAYWFCQVEAKTDDGFFLGFPSYWNLVAFYLYVLHFHVVPLPSWLTIGLLAALSVLTFVPSRYLYSVYRGRLNFWNNLLGGCWVVAMLWILYCLPADSAGSEAAGSSSVGRWLSVVVLGSLLFPAYYMVASWVISWRHWRHA